MKWFLPLVLLAGCIHQPTVHHSCAAVDYERSKHQARAILEPTRPVPTLIVREIKGGHRSAAVLTKYQLDLLQCSIEKYRARHENGESPREAAETRRRARYPWPEKD